MSLQALDALHAALAVEARESYWPALSRFLRCELPKDEFDTLAGRAGVAEVLATHGISWR